MPRGRLTRPIEEIEAPRRVSDWASKPRIPKPKRNGKVYHERYVGTGPVCPDDPKHGPMLDWGDGRWYCGHQDHGGNGKFFKGESL